MQHKWFVVEYWLITTIWDQCQCLCRSNPSNNDHNSLHLSPKMSIAIDRVWQLFRIKTNMKMLPVKLYCYLTSISTRTMTHIFPQIPTHILSVTSTFWWLHWKSMRKSQFDTHFEIKCCGMVIGWIHAYDMPLRSWLFKDLFSTIKF